MPGEQDMLLGAYEVWNKKGIGPWFPGNGVIALNYISEGNINKAGIYLKYAQDSSLYMVGFGLGDALWELGDSRLNLGNSIAEFLSENPGSYLSKISAPTGIITVVKNSAGITIGAFPENMITSLPVNVVQDLIALSSSINSTLTELWINWKSAIGMQPKIENNNLYSLLGGSVVYDTLRPMAKKIASLTTSELNSFVSHPILGRVASELVKAHKMAENSSISDTFIYDRTLALIGMEADTDILLNYGNSNEERFTDFDKAKSFTYAGSGLTSNQIKFAGGSENNLTGGLFSDDRLYGNSNNNNIYGDSYNDLLVGFEGADYLDGGSGADSMYGGTGDDTYIVDNTDDLTIELEDEGLDTVNIYDGALRENKYILSKNIEKAVVYAENANLIGNNLNNLLIGINGTTTFEGGKGSDTLVGSSLSDNYVYSKGDGTDVIIEKDGEDAFLTEYSFFKTVFYRVGNNLTVAMDSRYNLVTVADWFESDAKKIENWTFGVNSDNASTVNLRKDTIESIAGLGVVGTDNNDMLEATSNTQKTNVFVGGAGNDIITTSIGSNTILFSKQDGNDVVNLRGETFITTGAGLGQNFNVFAKNDGAIEVVWSTGESLLLRNIDGLNVSFKTTLMVEDGFIYTGTDLINKIVNVSNESSNFLHANSSSPDLIGYGGSDELWGDARSQDLNGGAGADIIYGNGGDDRFFGEGGDDLIYATSNGNGSTFFFSQQADNDTIYINNSNTNKIDTLRVVRGQNFDISPVKSDLVFVKKDAGQGDLGYFDAIISIKGRQDSVTIKNFFNPSGTNQCAIDRIVFDDGTVMNYAEICDKLNSYVDPNIIKGTPGVDSLRGNGIATKIYGYESNDVIISSAISEYLDGGAGADNITAGSGDIVVGGIGNDILTADGSGIVFKVGFGSGSDSITLSNSSNNFVDWNGVLNSDIIAKILGNDLLVMAKGDSVTLKNYFNQNILNTTKHISAIRLDDGTNLSNAELLNLAGYSLDTIYGTTLNDTIYSKSGVLKIYGQEGDDKIYGFGNQNETMVGGSGNDTLDGGAGYDTLIGEDGDDILGGVNNIDSGFISSGYNSPGAGNYYDGGRGNDTLNGTTFADTYVFNLGDGNDTIKEFELFGYSSIPQNQIDVIKFGDGISSEDILVSRNGNNLILTNKTNGDSITIEKWYYNSSSSTSYYQIERIEFMDGTFWTASQVTQMGLLVKGTPGNDTYVGHPNYSNTIYGGDGSDSITGGNLVDYLYGDAGSDVISGGSGNDVLYGGSGNDTLDGGAGYDTLIGEDGDDILGGVNNIDSGFISSGYNSPGAGNYYDGGRGNDTLNGTTFADTYVFNLGDGNDTIKEFELFGYSSIPQNQIDVIKFGDGISSGDILVSKSNLNLILKNKNTSESLTILNWFSSTTGNLNKIEQIQFADGTVWGIADLESRIQQPSAVVNAIMISPLPSFESSTSVLRDSVNTNLSLLLSDAQQDFVLKIGGTGYALSNETFVQDDLPFKITDGYLAPEDSLNKAITPTSKINPTKLI